MDKNEEQPKKCFCARCFLPIDAGDKIDIEGQNFHLRCSMCCICRRIPQSLKMFYGHVFCNDCFKTHVLSQFKRSPRFQCNGWCTQWGPGLNAQGQEGKNDEQTGKSSEEPCKRCICSRCLQAVDEKNKVEIGGQNFHTQCAKCYFCHEVPTSNLKIYYGQVFCEECFNRHILSRNKDNSSEFFKNCFEQWQSNAQFAESMREFMTGNANGSNVPFVFMTEGSQPSCRCGSGPQEWFQNKSSEPKKSATPTISIVEKTVCTWDLSYENCIEMSELESVDESAKPENLTEQKIEKLTKYIQGRKEQKFSKKWKNFIDKASELRPSFFGWVNLQDPKLSRTQLECPKCLWQCGPIYVNSDYLR